MHGDKGFPVWWLLWMAVIAGTIVYGLIAAWWREKELLAFAQLTGMQRLAERPSDLRLSGTEIERGTINKMWETSRAGIRVLVFDIRIGQGKGSWRRTVLAAHTDRSVFATGLFGRSLVVQQTGAWKLMYESRSVFRLKPGTLPVREISAHLDAIGSL